MLENLVSRDGFSRSVPRQPSHSPYSSGWIWCLLTEFLPISAAAAIYEFKLAYAIESVPSLSGRAIAYRWRLLPRVCRHRASKPRKVVPVTGAAFASPWTKKCVPIFSHTHYWYEVGYVCIHVCSSHAITLGINRYGCQSCSWSAEKGKCFFLRTRSRIRNWSRKKGSAVSSRVSPLILHTQSD